MRLHQPGLITDYNAFMHIYLKQPFRYYYCCYHCIHATSYIHTTVCIARMHALLGVLV